MKGTALLSPTDVNAIRKYVESKYSPLSGERRAEIVADAIRRVLQNHLPELPQGTKDELTNQLIRSFVLGEQKSIHPDDVLHVMSTDATQLNEKIIATLLSWLNIHTAEDWTRERLESRLQTQAEGDDSDLDADEIKYFINSSGQEEAAAAMALVGEAKPGWIYGALNSFRKVSVGLLLVMLLAGTAIAAWAIRQEAQPVNKTESISQAAPMTFPLLLPMPVVDKGMPKELQYHDIDIAAVKSYLNGRDSLLADEPYFGAIVESARNHDVHPLLLFAITGQEQGFVPKSHLKAERIINNPFNVFHSWEEYNTNISDSSDIAAKLLAKLGKSRPQGSEPFAWFNQTYAEDQGWSVGVRELFQKLNSLSSAR